MNHRLLYWPQMKQNSFALAISRRNRKASEARERLILAVRKLLLIHDPADITTTMVLREANVARNTLYLHFESHAQLLETALLQSFSETVQTNLTAFETAIVKAKSKSDFMRRVTLIVRESQSRSQRKFRIERCRLIVHSETNPSFAAVLAAEQNRITADFARLFDQCRQNDWMKGAVGSSAAALLVQALTLGKVIDDISGKKLPEDVWLETYMEIVTKVLLGA